LAWLGGGSGDTDGRASLQLSGVLVAADGVLAGVAAAATLHDAVTWPAAMAFAVGAVMGVVVAAVARGLVSGVRPPRGRGLLGRLGVAAMVGVLVGEFASLCLFSGDVDRALASRGSPAASAVAQRLDGLEVERARLDTAVDNARGYVDDALVVARCEANPVPGCPWQKVTGVPGDGPEYESAEQRLATAQRDLDAAVTRRDRLAPALDADIMLAEKPPSAPERGIGARWQAMHDDTLDHAGALVVRIAVAVFFVLLTALPLLLRRWRGADDPQLREWALAIRRQSEEQLYASLRAADGYARLVDVDGARVITLTAERPGVIEVDGQALTAGPVASTVNGHPEPEPPGATLVSDDPMRGFWLLALVNEVIPVPRQVVDFTAAAGRIVDPFLPPIVARALGIPPAPREPVNHRVASSDADPEEGRNPHE
jgi:hypothetical protein